MTTYAQALKHVDEERLLNVLHRYYTANDISFERAVREAGITVYEMIEYVRRKKLPIVWTEQDKTDGTRRVNMLMKKLA
ncbi:MAG: hypothetical protein HY619_02150 [Thaumarchaeota archaeon]|nr:hypothetical protein [Nitrososphaerota archaeon]